MKYLALLAFILPSCKNLTKEQNDRLLGAGLRVGETLVIRATGK